MSEIDHEKLETFVTGAEAMAKIRDEREAKLVAALEKYTLSDANKNRLVEVDAETLRMIILHGDGVATDALAEYRKEVGE
jgi:hypothetical protein